MLALITGPLGKIIGIGLIALSLAGAIGFGVHQYNSLIEARVTVAEQATTMAQMQKDRDRTVAALQAAAVDTASRLAEMQPIRKAISDAKDATACSGSPAIVAVVDGMRGRSASRNPGPASTGSGKPDSVRP